MSTFLNKEPPEGRLFVCGMIKAMKEVHVIQEHDVPAVAERVLHLLSQNQGDKASVVLLEGDLGAGKTTFTKSLASLLGVFEHVHSPTFILKKEYATSHTTFRKVVHVDAYRFNQPSEARVLRIEDDLADPATIIVVEWPSKMTYLHPDVRLDFSVLDDLTREVTITFDKDI